MKSKRIIDEQETARLMAKYAGTRLRIKLRQSTTACYQIDHNKLHRIETITACGKDGDCLDVLTTCNDNGKRKEYDLRLCHYDLRELADGKEIYRYSGRGCFNCAKRCGAEYTATYKLLD